jgi:hypothetical protein
MGIPTLLQHLEIPLGARSNLVLEDWIPHGCIDGMERVKEDLGGVSPSEVAALRSSSKPLD